MQLNDPGSRTYFGHGRDVSGLEVPDSACSLGRRHQVPSGEVRSRWYFAHMTKAWRRLLVYTPSGYDDDPCIRYPVLYLQHGAGEDETDWAKQVRVDIILDNLIAAGDVLPMMVVMASGYAYSPEPDRPWTPACVDSVVADFARLHLSEVMPTVDRTYRTIADRRGRAIGGLSMGGRQALHLSLAHADTFGWVAGMSPAAFLRTGSAFDIGDRYVDDETRDVRLLPTLVYLSAGFAEPTFGAAVGAIEQQLQKQRIPTVTSIVTGTSHEWQTWRRSFIALAPLLFR